MSDTEKDAPDFIRRLINAWDCCGTCAGGVLAQRDRERDARMAVQPTPATEALWGDGGLFDQISRLVAEAEQRALREAADEMVEFADETYPEDIFRRPTAEQYAEINALLKRERGHQLDGIAADVMSRAIKVQAARLREKADEVTP